MPELDKSNYTEAAYSRFIRSVKRIFFTDDSHQLHTDLESKYLLDSETVDDAGFLELDDGKLIAVGGSSSLEIAEDNDCREETDRILSELQR